MGRYMNRAMRLAPLLALALATLAASPDDSEAVRRGFSVYKEALLARDGAAAASAVSANSLAYYDRMRALALTGEKAEIQSLDGAEQMLVLSLRLHAPEPMLRSGTPAELIAHAVDRGMISPGTIARTELGAVEIEGDQADALLVVDGKPLGGGEFRFRREGDVWKFDLEHATSLTRGVFGRLARQRGVSEEALILDLLSRASGRPIGEEVWTPPASK